MTFEFFPQVTLTAEANSSAASMLAISDMLEVSIFLMELVRSLMNVNSSSLSLMIEHLLEMICYSAMGMTMVKGAWSDESLQLGQIEWLFSSLKPLYRNMRLMTEFESCSLSEYRVGTWSVGFDSSRLNESAIIKRSSLIEE